MTVAERLIVRIRSHGYPLPKGSIYRRTYAGQRQKEAGAWTWYIFTPGSEGHPTYAGYVSATDLLKCSWSFSEPSAGQRHVGDRTVIIDPADPVL